MKIHIIGGPGSGKSFMAEKLSNQYGIPHYDLDELQWDNEAGDYGTKRDSRKRNELLQQLLKKSELLKWADKYQQVNLVEIKKILEPYKDKVKCNI